MRIGGYDAPLFALVGGGFTAIAFVVIVVLNPGVAAIGVGWLLVGMVVYALYRSRQGLDLSSTHKVAIPQPVVDHEAEYDSVLVHIGDDGLRRAARRHGGQARGPQAPRHPHAGDDHRAERAARSTREMPEAEAAAASIIEQAKLQGGGRVSGHWEKVRAGQAGRRIIEEAQDMRAAAVVMGAAAPGRGLLRVRQDARDRARRAAVPRDHRVPAAGCALHAAQGGSAA